jgi:hypothetical protein
MPTGNRCTTLTKFPLAFSGGSRLKSVPAAPASARLDAIADLDRLASDDAADRRVDLRVAEVQFGRMHVGDRLTHLSGRGCGSRGRVRDAIRRGPCARGHQSHGDANRTSPAVTRSVQPAQARPAP